MSNMFDYLNWRGDILFSQLPPNPVDALIFSALSYIRFHNIVPEDPRRQISLRSAADALVEEPDLDHRLRVRSDLDLLLAAAQTPRFGRVGLSFYQDIFDPEEDTQFAAVTFYLEDGSAFLSFRGTDNSLVGWKEDFNMAFQESVPAQRLARDYVQSFAASSRTPMRLGGHSKGGNLAVYAAAKSDRFTQKRIIAVYNQDGPGFMEPMMTDPGYLNIVPKIKTYVPQSSVFGMMLEHEEPCIIIKSKQLGLMQHDPYSWEVMGGGFIPEEELTADSRFLDRTLKNWLAGMSTEERNAFFDSVFDILMANKSSRIRDLIRPQNIFTYIRTLHADDGKRQLIAGELSKLLEAAQQAGAKE